MAYTVFVVEDDENIGELIYTALSSASYQVKVFGDGGEFFKKLEEQLPDLVLLDIMLPGMNGHQILKNLRAEKKTSLLPVIFLTARGEEFDRAMGLEMGADDYIVKPFGVLELLARVKALLRRYEMVKQKPGGKVQTGGLTVDFDSREVTSEGEPVKLTYKEFELLSYLLLNRGVVLTRNNLLENVWGYDYDGDTTRTVDMHIKSLRQKLHDSADNPEYIETIRSMGYKFLKD